MDIATIIGVIVAVAGIVVLVKPLLEAAYGWLVYKLGMWFTHKLGMWFTRKAWEWLRRRSQQQKVKISVTDRDGLAKEIVLENFRNSSRTLDTETLKKIVELLQEADGGRTEDSSKE